MARLVSYLFLFLIVCCPALQAADFEQACDAFFSDDHFHAHDDAIVSLEACLARLMQTRTVHTDSDGSYSPERASLHDKIVSDLKSNKVCRSQPIALLSGGPTASGKSSFLRARFPDLMSEGTLIIDADEIRSQLPEYRGWNAAITQDETKDLVARLLSVDELAQPCLFDLVYDGTMSHPHSYIALIGDLKKMGYAVYVVYVDGVSLESSWFRSLERFRRTGRYVTRGTISAQNRNSTQLGDVFSAADGYMVVDGSKDFPVLRQGGTPPNSMLGSKSVVGVNESEAKQGEGRE